ncbi:efflux RND transporter periplasmic adaptor subunit [Shinella yambaruensis]|uniref:MexE family multidrug efflux RND transporter periplasmic adaptor subunit n=2 Tax=Shinella yambaruensis TaxID=415996 RepID=A0ABQ5ZPM3_9HYPH|nr:MULTISPECIES: efflux RND transporter periplasmic adaptor subunit [Shinella]MCJ8025280.1 efflux RND transporter periplasmic adaptor subunit [Shinella yambaruensis]MCU7981086.1 efflux RND transporter periplasmic adaptor subunit [Shinella yambaruensis]GLR53772.1 MexE family multidrug efflux RND transporter periplasmic adaptor subunit [Shinella yambaruensis]
MEEPMRFTRPISIATFGALLILAGCQDEQAPQGGFAFPPPQVAVVAVKTEDVPITNDLPGRIAATRTAEVRPRATGIVIERIFEQGSQVKEGDVLYRIDPAPFQVQVDSAEATLRRAKAVQAQARNTAERQEQLRKSNVASAQTYDDAVAQLAQADADVAIAEASLATAKLNLEYTEVKAPISGRIGRALITEGALVSANGTENLATIQQLDPVYADFTQSATDLMRLRKALEDGDLMADNNSADVKLVLDDGSAYPHPGKLLFSEAAVDETTGQVTLRGEFPNPDGDLLPGMYVRVQIEQGIEKNAVLVPQQAVQRDSSGSALVYVVSADNKAGTRSVRVGRAAGTRWVITDGLKDGEKIIVEGFQKVQPGGEVVPAEWNPGAVAGAQQPAAEGGAAQAGDAATTEGAAQTGETGKAEGGDDAAKAEQAK